jgi:CubicO group peptidase (beta-lactamase class C family)
MIRARLSLQVVRRFTMNITIAIRSFYCVTVLFAAQCPVTAQAGFTNDSAIKTLLHENFDGKNVCMVVGLVDEHGSRIFGAGGLDNGTSLEANGDTVFEIGSITKTFTALLLQDMVERGEMKLDDPVSKYLPASVKIPSRHGKEITLLELATHTSGLPRDVRNIASQNHSNPFDYTSKQLYAFLSSYNLTRDPGAKFEYSNLGMGLLGHAIALKTGKDYETLVVERICQPLHMNDTRATLTPELKARLAAGHNASGNRAENYDFRFQAMSGCGALRSTANDLLKYVSAQIGLTQSRLSPLIEKTHAIRFTNSPALNEDEKFGKIAMPWLDSGQTDQTGLNLLGHAGGTAGYSAYIGFDQQHHRGVVVLFNEQDGGGGIHAQPLGSLLLEGVPLTPQITAGLWPGKNGELVGIGIKLEFDHMARAFRISGIVPCSPASEAGLSAGLIVQKVDGLPTAGKSTDLCACYIRGKAGTKVRLELVNPERNETNTVELIRQKFMQPKQ